MPNDVSCEGVAVLLLMIPGPTEIDERVIRAMARQMIDHRSEEFRTLMKSIVENAKKIFETKSDVFVLTGVRYRRCRGCGLKPYNAWRQGFGAYVRAFRGEDG
jgi:hypothetical protein